MATAYVSFGAAGSIDQSGVPVAVRSGNPTSTEAMVTSGTTAQSAGVATLDGIVSIYSDAAHYAVIGDNPTAAPATGWYCPADIPVEIAVSKGQKLALITA